MSEAKALLRGYVMGAVGEGRAELVDMLFDERLGGLAAGAGRRLLKDRVAEEGPARQIELAALVGEAAHAAAVWQEGARMRAAAVSVADHRIAALWEGEAGAGAAPGALLWAVADGADAARLSALPGRAALLELSRSDAGQPPELWRAVLRPVP